MGLILSPALKDLDLGLPLDEENEPLSATYLNLNDIVYHNYRDTFCMNHITPIVMLPKFKSQR